MGVDHEKYVENKKIMNIPIVISELRNGIKANRPTIIIRHSKKAQKFLDVLIENKYILTYSIHLNKELHKELHVALFTTYKKNKILSLKHISKPGIPVSFTHKDLWKYHTSLTLIILNTSKGIISHQTALVKGLGGEALGFVS